MGPVPRPADVRRRPEAGDRAAVTEYRQLAALRVAALGISGADAPTPLVAVQRLLAMQAQDYAGALWSVGLRVPGATVASVESALASGQVVRSWPMRGTLHLVAAEDLGWMLGL